MNVKNKKRAFALLLVPLANRHALCSCPVIGDRPQEPVRVLERFFCAVIDEIELELVRLARIELLDHPARVRLGHVRCPSSAHVQLYRSSRPVKIQYAMIPHYEPFPSLDRGREGLSSFPCLGSDPFPAPVPTLPVPLSELLQVKPFVPLGRLVPLNPPGLLARPPQFAPTERPVLHLPIVHVPITLADFPDVVLLGHVGLAVHGVHLPLEPFFHLDRSFPLCGKGLLPLPGLPLVQVLEPRAAVPGLLAPLDPGAVLAQEPGRLVPDFFEPWPVEPALVPVREVLDRHDLFVLVPLVRLDQLAPVHVVEPLEHAIELIGHLDDRLGRTMEPDPVLLVRHFESFPSQRCTLAIFSCISQLSGPNVYLITSNQHPRHAKSSSSTVMTWPSALARYAP